MCQFWIHFEFAFDFRLLLFIPRVFFPNCRWFTVQLTDSTIHASPLFLWLIKEVILLELKLARVFLQSFDRRFRTFYCFIKGCILRFHSLSFPLDQSVQFSELKNMTSAPETHVAPKMFTLEATLNDRSSPTTSNLRTPPVWWWYKINWWMRRTMSPG